MIRCGLRVYKTQIYSKATQAKLHYNFVKSSGYDDAKLRDIIESSNLAVSKQIKSAKQTNFDQVKSAKEELSPKDEVTILLGATTPLVEITSTESALKSENSDFRNTYKAAKANYNKFVNALLDDSQNRIKTLAKALNQITGYTKIEEHKAAVQQLERDVKDARIAVRSAKKQFTDAIEKRSALQREVNELLTRKNNWSPADVERFTELYKSDHENQQNEANSKENLENAEQALDNVQLKLGTKILTRYHEEQLWSDKIRQALTWGTWIITGVNICLFAVATFFVEPWKRRRLVKAFHDEVQQQFDEYTEEIGDLSMKIAALSTKESEPPFKAIMADVDEVEFVQLDLAGQLSSWESIKTIPNYLMSVIGLQTSQFLMNKTDLGIYAGVLVTTSCAFASLLTYLILSSYQR